MNWPTFGISIFTVCPFNSFSVIYLIILLIPNYVPSFDIFAYEDISMRFILVIGTSPVVPKEEYGRRP
jgi:hypothetical protein